MTDAADQERGRTGGIYVGWDELHALVSPSMGRDAFRALIKRKIDTAGFPPFREEYKGFYWPKVRVWLDSDNDLGAENGATITHAEDGPENFDAPARKKARVQARPARPAVLDRQTGGARSDGVSRHLHSVAGGRER